MAKTFLVSANHIPNKKKLDGIFGRKFCFIKYHACAYKETYARTCNANIREPSYAVRARVSGNASTPGMKYINRNVLEFPIASAGKIYMPAI